MCFTSDGRAAGDFQADTTAEELPGILHAFPGSCYPVLFACIAGVCSLEVLADIDMTACKGLVCSAEVGVSSR